MHPVRDLLEVLPRPAIEIVDEQPVINYDYCKGCGICAEECPRKCIVMVEEGK